MVVVIGLLFFSLISSGNNAGFSQGYQMGYIAAGGEAGAAVAPMMHGHRFFSPFALFFGLIFKIGFFFLMLMFLGKAFHFLRWRMHSGSESEWDHDWESHKAKWADWKKGWSEKRESEKMTSPPKSDEDNFDRSTMI